MNAAIKQLFPFRRCASVFLVPSTSDFVATTSAKITSEMFQLQILQSCRRFTTFAKEHSKRSHVRTFVQEQQKIFITHRIRSITSAPSSVIMKDWEANLDPVQRQLLEEECIVLDDNDKVMGHDSKKNCHLVRNGDVKLHRAFSVFLFNSKGELLLQQRSKTKITFPLMWTNTCCSHPLFTPSEMEEEDAHGIKVAAKRRLEFELGISPNDIALQDFHYLTRIHYKALSNSIWGEHEIDYILFLQKDLPIKPNINEVSEIKYVTLDQIKTMAGEQNVQLTPWFELIYKTWLPLWWKNLRNLKPFDDHNKIHKM